MVCSKRTAESEDKRNRLGNLPSLFTNFRDEKKVFNRRGGGKCESAVPQLHGGRGKKNQPMKFSHRQGAYTLPVTCHNLTREKRIIYRNWRDGFGHGEKSTLRQIGGDGTQLREVIAESNTFI